MQLPIHFITRGMEFHNQLGKESSKFKNDEGGCSTKSRNKRKNRVGTKKKTQHFVREMDLSLCSVKILKSFLG